MIFYILLYTTCFVLAYIAHLCYQMKNINTTLLNTLDFLPYLILIIVTGFRYNVGTDYSGYSSLFDTFVYFSGYERVEFTYKFLVKIAQFLNFNQQFIFLVYALITYIFIYLAIRYYDKNGDYRHFVILFVEIYIVINSFNTIRQMAAVAIFFYATKFIVERNLIKYATFIVIAALLHNSALICLIFYFIPRLNKEILFLGLIVSPVFMLANFANTMMIFLFRFYRSDWYEMYLYSYNFNVGLNSGLNTLVLFIIAIFYALLIRKGNLDSQDKTIIKLFIVYVILLFMTLTSAIATRLLYYPMVSLLLIFPMLEKCFNKFKLLIKYCVFSYAIFLLVKFLIDYQQLFYGDGLLKYSFKIFV